MHLWILSQLLWGTADKHSHRRPTCQKSAQFMFQLKECSVWCLKTTRRISRQGARAVQAPVAQETLSVAVGTWSRIWSSCWCTTFLSQFNHVMLSKMLGCFDLRRCDSAQADKLFLVDIEFHCRTGGDHIASTGFARSTNLNRKLWRSQNNPSIFVLFSVKLKTCLENKSWSIDAF